MVTEPSGAIHELPEPTLLATVLIAAETDRRGILNRFAANFEEEIDAVASLFWPFLVVHAREGTAAIFDGTGVWRRTFRYTRMPSVEGIAPLIDGTLSPADHLAKMKTLTPYFGQDTGAEVLTVEGFLPVDPPLLFDVLSQAKFQTDPQAPHAGFLPARHKVEWYDELVGRMHQWLDRFEEDLRTLGDVRKQAEAVVLEMQKRLDAQYRAQEETAQAQTHAATEGAEAEVARLQHAHHTEIRRHLEAIRRAQAVTAHAETSVSTAETLSLRATHRRTDTGSHQARVREAQRSMREASRQIAEAREAIEKVHDQERDDQEKAIAKVAEVEKANAQALAKLELFRDEYVACAADLLQTIDGQIAARSTQRNLLSGYFLPLPALATVRVVWLPLWMATMRGPKGPRQVVFPPMQVRAEVGIGGALKRFFGGIVLPLEPRTAQFDKVLRPTMEEALSRDPWLSSATQELTRAADVLVDPDVLTRLQAGLGELKRDGWISRKQEEDFLRAYTDRARRRAVGGVAGPVGVPVGAKGEGPPTTGDSPGHLPPNGST